MFAAAQKLNNPPDMNAFGVAFSRASDDMDYWWYAWLGANGADGNTKLWDENGKSRFNTPEGIAATQFLVDLAQKYKAVNPDYMTASRDADLQTLFYNGKLAMLETGSWYPTLLKNNAPDLQVGIAAIPVAKAGMKHVTAFWPDAVMMFKQSKHPKEAAKFLEWMYSKENRLLFAKQRGVIPERIDVGADPGLRGRRHGEVLRRAAPDRQERVRDAVPRDHVQGLHRGREPGGQSGGGRDHRGRGDEAGRRVRR